MGKFELARRQHDKVINIENRALGIFLEVDYDDVNHYEIDEFVPLIISALNKMNGAEIELAKFKAKQMQKRDQMEGLGL